MSRQSPCTPRPFTVPSNTSTDNANANANVNVTTSAIKSNAKINNINNNHNNKHKSVEGCQKCGKDNDHSNLLLCEACNDEYHTYCLDPPLRCVPEGDFFCSKCKPLLQIFVHNNDQLDQKVSALSPCFTKRFGEIIWAAGGQGFGWWPACVYDPRLTVGGARKLAMKNLGKKHLVYFFGCTDAPFTVLPDQKCLPWDDGLMEELDVGKVAKTVGKNRAMMFEWALQAAIAENDKPIESRLDWNHEEDPFITGEGTTRNINAAGQHQTSTTTTTTTTTVNDNKKRSLNQNGHTDKKRNRNSNSNNNGNGNSDANNNVDLAPTRRSNRSIKPSSLLASIQQHQQKESEKKNNKKTSTPTQVLIPTKTNRQSLENVLSAFHTANEIEETFDSNNDDQFFCKILRKVNFNDDNITTIHEVNIGFITLSKQSSTFADARKKIHFEFDDDHALVSTSKAISSNTKKKNDQWKFYIPHLGPMSRKQEKKFGSMFQMLIQNGDGKVGNGTSRHPLKVIIYEC